MVEEIYTEPSRFERLHAYVIETGIAKVAIYLGLALFLVWSLFPVYWIVSASLKTRPELISPDPLWIPWGFHVENYLALFQDRPEFPRFILNSVVVTLVTTGIVTFLGAATSYAFVTFDFPYNLDFHLPFYILSTRFMPPIVIIIPLFIIYQSVGLVNSLSGLILTYSMFNLPFAVWMMKGFFDEFPQSIVESAILDGHSHFGAFFKIVLPLVKPGLVATAIFTMIMTWNELLFAVILAFNKEAITLPVGLAGFVAQYNVMWIRVAVGSTIAILPILLSAFILRDEIIRGFSMGAVEK